MQASSYRHISREEPPRSATGVQLVRCVELSNSGLDVDVEQRRGGDKHRVDTIRLKRGPFST